MPKVISRDGTAIRFDQTGSGPPLILVVGAFNDRTTGVPLAKSLEAHFTVFNYDRRGRGESGDTQPYTVEREIEDIDALIQYAGGPAFVFGYSSGAILALRAAAHGLSIQGLALYDPPPTGGKAGDLASKLAELIAAGNRGGAVELFQIEAVGIPANVVADMRNAPFRPMLENMAHTLVYESLILGKLPSNLIATVQVPTLVINGEGSHKLIQQAAVSLAEQLPAGQTLSLKGQGHDIPPDILAPELVKFFLEKD